MPPRLRFAALAGFVVLLSSAPGAPPLPTVVAEEEVYTFVPPDNGSGPLWSYGCTAIVRQGGQVIASQMETGEGVPKLCNTRWRLLERTETGWKMFAEAEGNRQREPCPIGVTASHGLFLYANDSLHPPGAEYLDCEPHLLRFDLTDKTAAPRKITPVWNIEKPYFTDHSYRGYGVDGPGNELLMLNIDAKTSTQHWCHLDAEGNTLGNGAITFPIRACYPHVALKNRAAHVLAIGDIVEPVEEWRQYKFAQTNQKWDYVFRILYYTGTPDIATQPFSAPIEIANVDDTAGFIGIQDLWIAPDGSAYLVYTESEVQNALMRDRFFPDKSVIPSLHLAVVQNGAVVRREVLFRGSATASPGCTRFQETPDGTVYAVAYLANEDPGNYLIPIYPEIQLDQKVKIPLKNPFSAFFLAGTRGGSAPSNTIDIFGHSTSGTALSYAQVTLE